MEDYSVIYKGTLTALDTEIFNDAKGCITKNFIFSNTQAQVTQVTLTFDDVPFSFELQANEFKHLDMTMFTQKIIATGENVNIHISGLQIT